MFERLTKRARKVLALTNQEAQRFKHEYIGTEHILLGLIKEGGGAGTIVLKNLHIDMNKLPLEVEKLVKSNSDTVMTGKLPQTPQAKRVIEYAVEEARTLPHYYVGTEHILLGLFRESEGIAYHVLMNLGLKLEDVRQEALDLFNAGVDDGPIAYRVEINPEVVRKFKIKIPIRKNKYVGITEILFIFDEIHRTKGNINYTQLKERVLEYYPNCTFKRMYWILFKNQCIEGRHAKYFSGIEKQNLSANLQSQ